MKLSTLLSFTPFLSAVTAQSQPADPFTLNVRWSNSPLNGPLNANRGAFWIGKPTAAYCPENIPHCPVVNTTSFVAQDGKLFLNTAVPGGQQGIFYLPLFLLIFSDILFRSRADDGGRMS